MHKDYISIRWKQLNCGSHRPYMCKRNKDAKPTPLPTKPSEVRKGHCPLGWFGTDEKCFKTVFLNEESGLQWIEAQNKCRSYFETSDLATINTEDENLLITSKMTNTDLNAGLWFGLYKQGFGSDAEWVWSDNTPKITENDYDNWDPDGQRNGVCNINK